MSQEDLGVVKLGGNGHGPRPVTLGGFVATAVSRPELAPQDLKTRLAALADRLSNARLERADAELRESLESLARALGVDRCDLLSAEATVEAEFVTAAGSEPRFTLPLRAGGQLLGSLRLGSFRLLRRWPELVPALELFASVAAGVLLRQRAATELENAKIDLERSRQEVRELKDRLDAETTYLRKEVFRTEGFDEIVGTSAELSKVLRQVEQVAAADSPVLILGETGTGKDMVARAIHGRSRRRERPLVAVNCAALPDALIESELFGYEKGAFTGAVTRTLGRFEAAHGGSILLDEIGELPLGVQAKLLRVLEGGTFERLGSSKTIRVDVRVIAATNRDVEKAVREGRFRPDLYYRLNVFPITVPPLRERSEDVPLLVWHFINAKQGKLGRSIKRVPDRLMRALETCDWPGNIRELENVIERALILTSGTTLAGDASFVKNVGDETPGGASLDEIQRAHIQAVLRSCGWKVAGKGNAAERLGMKRGTLQFRMAKLGIRRPDSGS